MRGSLGGHGVLFAGRRVAPSADGTNIELATTVAPEPLIDGLALPARFGGGFLFWTRGGALYRSTEFLGALEPVVQMPDPMDRTAVSLGPSFVLVDSGVRPFAIDVAAKRRLRLPDGLREIVAIEDGRALRFVGSELQSSTDGGQTWQSLPPLDAPGIWRLAQSAEQVWVVSPADAEPMLELGRDGHLQRREAPETIDVAVNAIEEAVRHGVVDGQGKALALVAGRVQRVDLATGDTEHVLTPVQTTASHLVHTKDGLVLLGGSGEDQTVSVYGGLERGELHLERTFSPSGPIVLSAGVLLSAGPCHQDPHPDGKHDNEAEQGAVCVRLGPGRWKQRVPVAELGPLRRPGSQGSSSTGVLRYVPRVDGSVTAVLTHPEHKSLLLHAGHRVELDVEASTLLRSAVQAERQRRSTRGVLVALEISADGMLRGWHEGRAFAIRPDGTLVEPRRTPRKAHVTDGPRALAVDDQGRTFQSTDWGEHWIEIEPVPAAGPVDLSRAVCSEVGCHLGTLLRIGWGPQPPLVRPSSTIAPQPTPLDQPSLPLLRCRATEVLAGASDEHAGGLGLGKGVRAEPPEGRLRFLGPGLRPESLGTALRSPTWAVLAGRWVREASQETEDWAQKPAPLWFVDPFDPASTVQRLELRPRDLSRAVRLAGASLPATCGWFEGTAVPVLGPVPGRSGGQLLYRPRACPAGRGTSLPLIWLRHHPRPRLQVVAVSPGVANPPLSIAWLGPDRLAALGGDGVLSLMDASGGPLQATRLRPHVVGHHLALAADGSLWTVRLGGSLEPPPPWEDHQEPSSRYEPAVAVDPDGGEHPLAPWSTLRPAHHPDCRRQRGGVRLIAPAWLRLELDGSTAERAHGTTLVRWSEERVCLEAIDLSLAAVPLPGREPLPGRLVARLLRSDGAATRVVVDRGVDYRQRLECEIVAP